MQNNNSLERNQFLLQSNKYKQSQWTRITGVKMRKKKDIINIKTKKYARVGVCIGCSLYSFVCGSELELSKAASSKISEENQKLLSTWSPGYWQTMGSLLGCLISGISLCYMGRRTSLQRVAVPLLAIACCVTFTSTKIRNESSLFLIMITLQIFMQNMCKSLSMIIPSIYILETICWRPGSYKSRAIAVLLALTQIPPAVSHLMISVGLIKLNIYTALILPLKIMLVTILILNLAPESPRWLLQVKHRVNEATISLMSLWSGKTEKYDIDKEITSMEREMQVISTLCEQDSYFRPLLVLSCFLLLVQLMGSGAYHFYTSWAYNYSGLTMINSDIVTSLIRLFTIFISTSMAFLYPGPRYTSIILIITTCLLMLSLIITGIFLYTLEQGRMKSDQIVWLPVVLLIIYQISFWFGIGTYAIPTCSLIMPPKSRPIILTISVTVYQMASYFCDVFLPLMISVLHPYGVFWFHACLTSVGLVFISLVIVPELKWTAKCLKNDDRAETMF